MDTTCFEPASFFKQCKNTLNTEPETECEVRLQVLLLLMYVVVAGFLFLLLIIVTVLIALLIVVAIIVVVVVVVVVIIIIITIISIFGGLRRLPNFQLPWRVTVQCS